MSGIESCRLLWIAALVTMPVPFYLGEIEWAPVVRLAFFTALFWSVILAEGGGTSFALGGIGLLQALLYTGLFFLGAKLVARGLERLGSPALRTATVVSVVFLLVTSSLLPIYETPLSSTRLRSRLLDLFE